jgi:hypothetical protein
MKPELFRKPSWDKTNDPTIDPTLLDPATGLPVNGKSIQSLSKRHLFTADEWAKIMKDANLQPVIVEEVAPEVVLPKGNVEVKEPEEGFNPLKPTTAKSAVVPPLVAPVVAPVVKPAKAVLTPEEVKAAKREAFLKRMEEGRAKKKLAK